MSGQKDLPRRFAAYTLEEVLGRGSISTAFRAIHCERGEKVVVKQIHPFLAQEREQVDLFVSEAQVLSELQHPAVGRILDVGIEDGIPYLALEFIEGRDLDTVLQAQEHSGPFPIPVAIHVVGKVAEALHYVHSRQGESGKPLEIVHRDMSMNNIMVRFDGSVLVVDFGIAKSTLRETLTAVGHVRGTPGYMAPEQLLGNHVDARTDVFVLGVVLYRLVTGKAPFPVVVGDFASYRAALNTLPVPPHLVNPEVPESLAVVILQAMQKDHVRRYQSAEQFARDLAEVQRQESMSAGQPELAGLMASLFPRSRETESHRAFEDEGDEDEGEPTILERRRPGSALEAAMGSAEDGGPDFDEAPTETHEQSTLEAALRDARLDLPVEEDELDGTLSATRTSKPEDPTTS